MAESFAVTALPRQLSHWKSQLALFPDDIALALGPMVARLSALLGGAPFDHAPEGQPDGFGGLSQRGTYDRLLVGEWLLLDEIPDEFLRRAASGEHLFLERNFQSESGVKQTTALFDAGADQLGAPRLAQLALLVALAKRAEDSGATLKWGIFQDETTTLHQADTPGRIRRLISARCARRVDKADVERWVKVPEVCASSEIWFAGAENLAKRAREQNAWAILISDVTDSSPSRRICVRAVASGSPRVREAVLDVPDDAVCVRVLRDPFGSDTGGRQTAAAVDLGSSLVFSADGRKLFVKTRSGALIAFPIPNSPRAAISGSQIFVSPGEQTILAVGQSSGAKRRTVVLAKSDGRFVVHTLSKRGGVARQTAWFEADGHPSIGEDTPLRALGVFNETYVFVDVAGDLIALSQGTIAIHASSVMTSRAGPQAFSYIRRGDGGVEVWLARLNAKGALAFERGASDLGAMPEDARFHFSPFGRFDFVAYSRRASQCLQYHSEKLVSMNVPEAANIVAIANFFHGERPMFVLLGEDKLRVEGARGGAPEFLFSATSPIVEVAASDTGATIAYLTESGEVGIYSQTYKTVLHRFAAGAAQ